MTQSVRRHALDSIHAILNEGAYSNLEINDVLSSQTCQLLIKGYTLNLYTGTIKRNSH